MLRRGLWRMAGGRSALCCRPQSSVQGVQERAEEQEQQEWEAVIGIEVHAQLCSRHKLTSHTPSGAHGGATVQVRAEGGAAAALEFDSAAPNSRVGLADGGLPGALPGIDGECVRRLCRTGAALGGSLQQWSRFDRKHYFYPDLPCAYQITQQFHPLVIGGSVVLRREDYVEQEREEQEEQRVARRQVGARKLRRIQEQEEREQEKQRRQQERSGMQERQLVYTPPVPDRYRIGVTRIHLEHDSGKSLHDQVPGRTLIDLNRSGMGLMEIVSEPEIRSGLEAAIYVRKLQTLMQHLGTSEASMASGSLRCDVNVSVRRRGETSLGDRCEIKNLNSLRSLRQAVDYEIQRQAKLVSEGKKVPQETRGFNVVQQSTFTMRRKETEVDYRYMPEPDLPPLVINDATMASFVADMPELPDARMQRYTSELGISWATASVMVNTHNLDKYFDKVAHGRDAEQAAHWVTNELLGLLAKKSGGVARMADCPVSAEQLGSILDLIENKVITGSIGKKVLAKMFAGEDVGKMAGDIVKKHNWEAISGEESVADYCRAVLDENVDQVAEYLASDDNKRSRITKFFMGQVMKKSKGKADPALATATLEELIQHQASS